MKKIAFFLSLLILIFAISYQKIVDDIAAFSYLGASDINPSNTNNTLYPQDPADIDSSGSDHIPAPTSAPESSSTPVPVTPAPLPTSGPASEPASSPAPSPEKTVTTDPPANNISHEVALNIIPLEYQQLNYFNPDNAARYVGYKDLNPDFDYEKVIVYVNIGLDLPFYTNINTISETNRIDVLVNKYNKLPDNFVPQLEQLPASLCAPGMGNQYLRKEAKKAFEKMHYDAKKMGLNITAYGTYRSIELQHNIWNSKVQSGRTIADVDSLNSRGGHSEHHTGLAVDVIINNYTVEDSAEFKWYKDNAHHYGFIIRYPNGKENITGYAYEPWHLRYLGPALATEVYNSGLTFEEYYAKMIVN